MSILTHFIALSLGTGIGFILCGLLAANKSSHDDNWPMGV